MAVTPDLKVVCLLNVLGFENILNRLGLGSLRTKYESLIEYVKSQTGGIDIAPTPDGMVAVGWLVLGNAYFSDTMLFWTRYSTTALPSFSNLVAEAVCYGFEIELPLRGAIAVGEAVLEREGGVFLGDPLVEVARTERAQEWIGVSFGPSFLQLEFNRGFYLKTVLPYKSQYKDKTSEYATGIAIDWPRRWRETRKSDPRPVVRSLDLTPKYSSYYVKALDFIDFSEKNHDWFQAQQHLDYG